jgi:4-hydroxy-tetrahydrodipicolinate synthase
MTDTLPRGVFAALLTLYDEDERVDVPAVAELALRLVDAGVHGLVVCGSTGEFHLLEPDERRALLEAVVRAVDGRVPVIAQAGAGSTRAACALAEHAVETGAAGVLAVTPYYNQTDAAGMREHLTAIAAAAGGSVLAYSIRSLAGTVYPLPLLQELAEAGIVRGVKESDDQLGRLLALIARDHDGFAGFTGSATLVSSALLAGGQGGILALGNAAPETCVAVAEDALAGDGAEANRRFASLETLMQAIAAAPAPAGLRAAAALRFGCPEHARRPLHPVSPVQRAAISDALAALAHA